MNGSIPESLGLKLQGVAPEVRLAAQVLIGLEVPARKRELGCEGEGSWQQHRGPDGRSSRPLWADLCRPLTGASDVTALKFVRMAKAVKLRFASRPETKAFAVMMESLPSTLTAENFDALREAITREVTGTTRKELVAEAMREPANETAGKASVAEATAEPVGQAPFRFPQKIMRKALKTLRRRIKAETIEMPR